MPATEAVAEDAHLPPLPRMDRRALFEAGEWRAAQDQLSGPLADLAVSFGALEERMHAGPADQNAGWRNRLALLEVADLGWWSGERIGVERLALWVGLRLGATGEDAQALARAGWAVRRLTGGQGPAGDGSWGDGIAAFLGRSTPETDAVPEAVADLAEVMAGVEGLHPATQAAVLFHTWRMLGADTPGQGATHDIEAAVMAARLGATMGRKAGQGGKARPGALGNPRGDALFMPLALSGPTALRATGPWLKN